MSSLSTPPLGGNTPSYRPCKDIIYLSAASSGVLRYPTIGYPHIKKYPLISSGIYDAK